MEIQQMMETGSRSGNASAESNNSAQMILEVVNDSFIMIFLFAFQLLWLPSNFWQYFHA